MTSPEHASIRFTTGAGGLPVVQIETPFSSAEIHRLGATITHFQKHGSEPLLFVSEKSAFEVGTPIRGGIPLVFPWFGGREGKPSHGWARRYLWDVEEVSTAPDGTVTVTMRLPPVEESAGWPEHELTCRFTIGRTLACYLTTTNRSTSEPFEFENLLHTYFLVGDSKQLTVAGLQGARYIDHVTLSDWLVDDQPHVVIDREVDRIYAHTDGEVALEDPVMKRRIRVVKTNSRSTVVWNPWIAKSQRMPDFGDEEYHHMICIEPGNVRDRNIHLAPGESTTLGVELIEESL